MNLVPAQADDAHLERYISLFRVCFPMAHQYNLQYMRWLYAENPNGRVIGMDALDGSILAAHYACVPTRVSWLGDEVAALLSLNTATHPAYRGRGLFTQLAESTYRIAADSGFAGVYGVANANSTPGFVRRLGFNLIAPLDARIGVGRQLDIDWNCVVDAAEFRRAWSRSEISWRSRNPANPVRLVRAERVCTDVYARTDKPGVWVWGQLPVVDAGSGERPPRGGLRLFLGLAPVGCAKHGFGMKVPRPLRPSPLNFVIRGFGSATALDARRVSFTFFDFDAY